jgi:nucleotide-binding universal stress UspA family protein
VGTYKVVVGVDGSEGSAAAVAWCARMAPLLDAEVIAVHAVGPEASLPGDEQFGRWCAPLVDAGVSVRRVVEENAADRLLRRIATAEDAELIVIGGTSRGQLAGLVLGSVVQDLAHQARRPIVIVPPREPDPSE